MSLNNKTVDLSSWSITRKELQLFFASPIGYLFLGVFVAFTLFIFFWAESYFARNIADVRPMFEWMPVLLIFLSAAITMRMWSEERRTGTLEHVMTLPVSTWQFVQGKFGACKMLLILALLLTLPLPITISLIGNLDWGPVISGYLATVLLGSAYIAIGLYVSSRSDNQIVSLIVTALVCGVFYMLGSGVFTNLVSNDTGETLRLLGSGSRFESITRGVLDIRDFYYYISIAVVFLVLNRYSLERDRWAADGNTGHHNRWRLVTGLIAVNVLAFNFVLAPFSSLRIDTTEGKIYSISDATRGYLGQLQEPLLIRGYFSAKTHPLLAPLVPEVKDLLKEYETEGKGNIRVEFIDPVTNAEAEEEANSKYGIRPVPFRVADRYQSAVVNSYFNILVQYGDEYKVIGFDDLIEVKAQNESDLDVKLRNPEYDITNAIKQVLYAYQSGGNLFDSIGNGVHFTAYVSRDQKLPKSLAEFNGKLRQLLADEAEKSSGKFTFNFIDPESDAATAQKIADEYGFQPMASSLFDTNTFYYYFLLTDDHIAVQISLPDDLTEEAMKRALDAGLKRFASGFVKTIGFVAPESNPYAAQMGQPPGASFNALQQSLNDNVTAKPTDLKSGKVPEDIDLLMVMAPENLDEASLFALDQYLMRGGTVIMATSPYRAQVQMQQQLTASEYNSNLGPWLDYQGLSIDKSLVMDQQNTAFPIPVTRQVGMFSVREISLLDYPYFPDMRSDELNQKNPVTSGLQQLTVPWASPILLDDSKNAGRTVVRLAQSSPSSWLSSDLDISPKMQPDGSTGFTAGQVVGPQLVAASVTGRFESFFADKESPLLKNADSKVNADTDSADNDAEDKAGSEVISTVIKHSPESARLILISSNAFAEDGVLRLQSSMAGNNYVNPLQFMINSVDWSLEDEGLLSIRSRSHFNRTLPPLSDEQRQFWEFLNYGLAVLGLIIIILAVFWQRQRTRHRYMRLLSTMTMQPSDARASTHNAQGAAA